MEKEAESKGTKVPIVRLFLNARLRGVEGTIRVTKYLLNRKSLKHC